LELNDRERRLIYLLRKLHFARVVVHVENGCVTVGDIMQTVRLDRAEPAIDFSEQKCYTEPIAK
jgi:hypothetical protein